VRPLTEKSASRACQVENLYQDGRRSLSFELALTLCFQAPSTCPFALLVDADRDSHWCCPGRTNVCFTFRKTCVAKTCFCASAFTDYLQGTRLAASVSQESSNSTLFSGRATL